VRAREQYLQALGVDVWVPRVSAGAPARRVETPVTPETPETPEIASVATAQSPEVAARWDVLQAQVRECTLCSLCQTRTQTVFGVGPRRAELMVIGEAPGQDEDEQGEPFVGRAGQLLNSMLKALGHPRERVFIANILKCRPPNNRNPNPNEVASCMPYLQQQIDLIQPRMILAVGGIAAQNLLATDVSVGRLRGLVHRFGTAATPLIVTYHPAYLLRSPGEKRKVWTDLKFARAELARARGN
jgi:uracil-DNA glycosylase family 4